MIGRTAGAYLIVEKLGEGAMGTVYRGVDQMVERSVAIKVLKPEIAGNAEMVERFRSEAVALARLNHPAVAQLYAFFREGEDLFMAMEFVPGETLEVRIGRDGRLAWQEALKILAAALEGVSHAHGMGILHRDLKPANVMLTPDGRVKVMDFGIARVLNSARLTREARLLGTLEYLAPERALGKPADARSDIYSLGMVLYEMLAGRLPFVADTDFELIRAQLNQKPLRPHELGVVLPAPVEGLLMRALEKDPELRFPDAAVFLAEVGKASRAAGAATPMPLARPVPAVGRSRRLAAGVGAALLATVLCSYGIWQAVAGRKPRPAPVGEAATAPAQPVPLQALGPPMTLSSVAAPPAESPAPAEPASRPDAQPAPPPSRATAEPDMGGVLLALAATDGAADPGAPLHYPPLYRAMRLGGAAGAPVISHAVDRRGVDFRLSEAQSEQLRAAGAPDSLLQAIRNRYREIRQPERVAVVMPPPPEPPPAPRPAESAPPAAEKSPPVARRRIETLENVGTLFVQPMPGGFDKDLREAIAGEVGERLRLVSRAVDADAVLEISLDKDKGPPVLGATARLLGLKAGQKAYVRMIEPRSGRVLWSAEAGDRSVLSGQLGNAAKRMASRLAKRLKRDLQA